MTLYLMNSPVLTDYGDWRLTGPLSLERARELAASAEATSAIGHEETARWLSDRLQLDIAFNRQSVRMRVGDRALVLRSLRRLSEGGRPGFLIDCGPPFEFSLLTRIA